jgi:hypothetical protein
VAKKVRLVQLDFKQIQRYLEQVIAYQDNYRELLKKTFLLPVASQDLTTSISGDEKTSVNVVVGRVLLLMKDDPQITTQVIWAIDLALARLSPKQQMMMRRFFKLETPVVKKTLVQSDQEANLSQAQLLRVVEGKTVRQQLWSALEPTFWQIMLAAEHWCNREKMICLSKRLAIFQPLIDCGLSDKTRGILVRSQIENIEALRVYRDLNLWMMLPGVGKKKIGEICQALDVLAQQAPPPQP